MHKILVADDNWDILKVMEIVLRTNHYDVALESDGSKVVKAIQDFLPDLVFLDVSFGGVSGIDICKEIKITDGIKTIPVIIFSANVKYAGINKICGDDFLFKGFSVDELLAKIDLHLNCAP